MRRESVPWWAWLAIIVPWIAGAFYYWRRRPSDGFIPPSMADAARKRLWTH